MKKMVFAILGLIFSIPAFAVDCYQSTGGKDDVQGLTQNYTMSLLIQNRKDLVDEFILISGKTRANMGLWCHEMKNDSCAIEAADTRLKVQKSADGNELTFTFPGKIKVQNEGKRKGLWFDSKSKPQTMTFRKAAESACPKTDLELPSTSTDNKSKPDSARR